MKKVLSVFAVLLMLVSLFSAFLSANANDFDMEALLQDDEFLENGFVYTVDVEGATIEDYWGDGGDVVIPEFLDGYPVVTIGRFAFSYCDSLTSVTISRYIRVIGEGAFTCCDNLKEVKVDSRNERFSSVDGVLFMDNNTRIVVYPGAKTGSYIMPDTVKYISKQAFMSCELLEGITFSENLVRIEAEAFGLCTSLKNIVIPDKVTKIETCAFWGCNNLETFVMGDNVNYIEVEVFGDNRRVIIYAPHDSYAYQYAKVNNLKVKASDIPEDTTTTTTTTTTSPVTNKSAITNTTVSDEFEINRENGEVRKIIGVVIAAAVIAQCVALVIVIKKKKV